MSELTLADHVRVVNGLVHRLGGPSAVAVWCGSHISADAVTAWGLRNTIPWRWRARIKAMASARGVHLSAAEQKVITLDFSPGRKTASFALGGAVLSSGGSPMAPKGLRLAIEAAGSMGKLGRKLGISAQAIQQWRQVPADRIVAVEEVTGVPRERLRPDLFRREGEAVS
jgi:hypothetical protein